MRSEAILPIALALLLAGCAAQSESSKPAIFSPAAAPTTPGGLASIPPAASGYKLTTVEQSQDCPKLTGQMRVRMANMRAAYANSSGTITGQTLQTLATPVFGGSRRGSDPMADLQLDRAKLDAFNRRLAEKKCKTLDIDAELRGEPQPSAAAPAKGAAK